MELDRTIRPIAFGVAFGGLAAALYLAFANLPGAQADEAPVSPLLLSAGDLAPSHSIDPGTLVRIGDEAWSITTDPGVSLDPISTQTVTKIAYGRATVVNIVTTASGVYSSDAITSPHIRYPGVHVARKPDDTAGIRQLAVWAGGGVWIVGPADGAESFVHIAPFAGGVLVQRPDGTCVIVKGSGAC